MRSMILIRMLFVVLSILLNACGSIKDTIQLGNVDVNAPVSVPPTHININKEPGSITFSPKMVFNSKSKIETSSESKYIGTINMSDGTKLQTNKNNILWKTTNLLIGADLDFILSKNISIFCGINFSDANKRFYAGGNFGIGLISQPEDVALRFDAGISFQEVEYDAISIVTRITQPLFGGGQEKTIFYLHDRDNHTNINSFFTLTLNGAGTQNLINYFFSIAYFTQDLLGYSPHGSVVMPFPFVNYQVSDRRTECKIGFFHINPGIIYKLNENAYVNASVKFLFETRLESIGKIFFVQPALQLDWRL